jgi:serine protease Do
MPWVSGFNISHHDISVRLASGKVVDATVAGTDVDGDLAILEAKTEGAAALQMSDSEPAIGQPVFAVSVAARGLRVTFGLTSAVDQAFRGPQGRRISGSIEHTAPMARGSSGSALVDASGKLLGLNTNRVGGGLYQALPMDAKLQARIESLAAGKSVERARLGIAVAPSWVAGRMRTAVGLEPRDGLLVREVDTDGSAGAAGIAVGDLIVGVGDRTVTEPDHLTDALEASEGVLEVRIIRGTDESTVSVALAT